MKSPEMRVVDGRGFDEIRSDLAEHITEIIRVYGFTQKMATRLVHEAWGRVEEKQAFRVGSESYVREHLKAQIYAYIRLGIHEQSGFSEEEFRVALEPLVRKTVNFFSPPAGHPICDGEFTCFLVLPPEWGISLRFLLGKLYSSHESRQGFREILDLIALGGEVARGGDVAPKTPYVLVGLKVGRGLKEHVRAFADREREKFGFRYLSAYQLGLLLSLRPKFLSPGEIAVALGEKFPDERYVEFTAVHNGFTPSLLRDPSASALEGVGKPHYSRLITL